MWNIVKEYCPVCEDKGFTHGPCLVCGRRPKFQITIIEQEETEEAYREREGLIDVGEDNWDLYYNGD